jgi:hypothetical protein
MTRKPAPKNAKRRDPEEYKRFLETAREVEADEEPEAFERAFKRVTSNKTAPSTPSGSRPRRNVPRSSS